jgi:hypothetical protein
MTYTQEDKDEHEKDMAKITTRKEAFAQSPVWFTLWDWGREFIEAVCWVLVIFLMAQCSCDGCIVVGLE